MTDRPEKQTEENKTSDFEAKQNAVGFFNLLLKIDKRKNPEKYKNRELNSPTNKKC